jgi:hypothetical protein
MYMVLSALPIDPDSLSHETRMYTKDAPALTGRLAAAERSPLWPSADLRSRRRAR